MSEKKFASHADLEQKKVSFDKLSDNAYAYTAEGDPNTGVIIGEDAVMIIDATATPVMAGRVVGLVGEGRGQTDASRSAPESSPSKERGVGNSRQAAQKAVP
jgi:hypothetical protein